MEFVNTLREYERSERKKSNIAFLKMLSSRLEDDHDSSLKAIDLARQAYNESPTPASLSTVCCCLYLSTEFLSSSEEITEALAEAELLSELDALPTFGSSLGLVEAIPTSCV